MNLRRRLAIGNDRAMTAMLAGVLAVATLGFGGLAWWARPAIAGLTTLFVLGGLARALLEGRMRLLRSPMTALGALALILAVVQLAPLPSAMARRLSPRSQAVYARGYFPDRVLAADPSLSLPEPAQGRSPATLDRAATLRWLAGASVCLGLFWGVAQFADRLERLYLVWGCIVAAFFLNTSIGLVQLVSGSGGVYGFLQPGEGPAWGPSVADLMDAPGASALRLLDAPKSGHPAWAATVPDKPFLIGTMLGGPGAYLALGSIGLPLALALTLQLLAPRGSRADLATRLRESGQGSLAFLLVVLLVAGAALVGMLAGPWLGLPFAIGLAVAGLLGVRSTGLRWTGFGLTAMTLLALGAGIGGAAVASATPGEAPAWAPARPGESARVWADAIPMARDFPWLGTGLGSFASAFPHYKSRDEAPTTALSSVLQWGVESGAAGLALLVLALLWCLCRVPGAVRRVGTADRSLVFGLIGAAVSFTLFAAVHWTVELPAVAVVASAWGGTLNRCLAGGTDLFVERG